MLDVECSMFSQLKSPRPACIPARSFRSAKSSQHLRNIPRAVEDADYLQAARLARHAVENQIIREAAHRPEAHPGKLGQVGLVTGATLRQLRPRAKAQKQCAQKTPRRSGVVHREEQMNVRKDPDRF